ncbi:MAG: TSUP family transporter [Spirochaetes bacterium]|nr:TSUP family transporter [Spirochaetota bacterium]
MVTQLIAICIGFIAGILGGILGIGGGIVMIPSLIYLLGYSQHLAQGTTLAAMVLPIGILAAWEYYKNNYVNVSVALLIALGFVAGGFLGAKLAVLVNESMLKKFFGIALLIVAIKMVFFD